MSANKEFIWTDDCEEAFKRLKSCLVAAPVLRFPDLGRPYILETDASAKGLGAQRGEDGKIHPIAYASRTTQGAERNYGSSELEALAVVWATRHFRHYLYGTRCTVLMDNAALKSLLATPHPSGCLARWGFGLTAWRLSTIQEKLTKTPTRYQETQLEVRTGLLRVLTHEAQSESPRSSTRSAFYLLTLTGPSR